MGPMGGRKSTALCSLLSPLDMAAGRVLASADHHWLAGSAGRLARHRPGQALAVWQLDLAAGRDGSACFAMCFMLVAVSCALGQSLLHAFDCLVIEWNLAHWMLFLLPIQHCQNARRIQSTGHNHEKSHPLASSSVDPCQTPKGRKGHCSSTLALGCHYPIETSMDNIASVLIITQNKTPVSPLSRSAQ